MKRAIIAAIFSMTGAAHATQQFDVEAYHRSLAVQGMEEKVQQCVFETVQTGMVMPRATIKSAIAFSSSACGFGLRVLFDMAGVPQDKRNEAAQQFVYPIIKLALASLNPALIEGWPEILPEGQGKISDLAK